MEKTTGLTYDEAMDALEDGKMIKLPEWIGHWFRSPNTGIIKIFTRDGDILEEPAYPGFDQRKDWQITDGKKGFEFAILALKNNKLVTRTGWNGKGMFIFKRPEDTLTTGFIPKVKSLPQDVKDWIDKNLDDK